MLLDNDADPDLKDKEGRGTPLISAATNGSPTWSSFCSKKGAKCKRETKDGNSPLLAAAVNGSLK